MTVALAVFSLVLVSGQAPAEGDPSLPPGSLGAPPAPDTSPTAWSCTVETLKVSRQCVFESEASKSTDTAQQAKENVKFAKGLARPLCEKVSRPPREARPDKRLLALCQQDLEAASELCGLDGEWPLVDAKGRFYPGAKDCYRAIEEALQRTTVTAALAAKCCQCLAERHCSSAGDACYRDVGALASQPATLQCMTGACRLACQGATPRPNSSDSLFNQPEDPAPQQPVKKTSRHEL